MADEEKYRVACFDGKEFDNWLFRLKIALDERDLLSFIKFDSVAAIEKLDQTKDAVKIAEIKLRDKQCKAMIIRRIADSHLEYIKDKESSFDVVSTLQAIFARKSVSNQLFLRKRLLTMKCDDGMDLERHFLDFDKIVRELKSMGATIEPLDAICNLLLTLPESFNVVVTAIETMDPANLTMEFVKSRLLDEANKKKCNLDSCSVNEVAAMNAGYVLRCYFCKQTGHKKSDCPKWKSKRSKKRSQANVTTTSESPEIVFLAGVDDATAFHCSENLAAMRWVIDSGATEHMVNSVNYFSSMDELVPPLVIGVAKNGVTLSATKIGKISGFSVVDGVRVACSIDDVLFIENLKCNLFSISSIEKKGFRTVFVNSMVGIWRDDRQFIKGLRRNKLYEFEIEVNMKKSQSISKGKEFKHDPSIALNGRIEVIKGTGPVSAVTHRGRTSIDTPTTQILKLWHKRFGHLNQNSLKRLFIEDMVDGIGDGVKGDLGVCEPCIFGKHCRRSFSKTGGLRSKRVLELIHSDVCGPLSPSSWDGKRYVLTFVDDYTHFTTVYIIANKSDVAQLFVQFSKMVQARFGQTIVKLRCDNGGEYRSNFLKKFCSESGIEIEYTVPHTPELNGVAERMNRTLLERARSMMNQCGLQKKFWNEAVQCAAYAVNRSPTNAMAQVNSNKIPAELWYEKRQNVSNLRVFGCVAYAHIPGVSRKKLDSKSHRCIMFGYATNGYRLWDLQTEEIIIRRDVVFDENRFVSNIESTSVVKESSSSVEEISSNPLSDMEKSSQLPSGFDEQAVLDDDSGGDETIVDMYPDRNFEALDEPRRNPVRSCRQQPPQSNGDGVVSYAALALNAEQFVDDIPNSFADIKDREDANNWMEAVESEMNSLLKNNTWTLVEPPRNRSIVSCKWVFKRKRDECGHPVEYKARLVARGFTQRQGFDFDETYAPVVKIVTLRVLLAVATQMNMHIHQMDVKTAFLNGNLNEEIYMRQPDGFVRGNLVCKLNKSLYGLKQASRMWNERFHDVILKLGFDRSMHDSCLYIKRDEHHIMYLLIYVDDLLLIGNNIDDIKHIKTSMSNVFEMKDMEEVKQFLGIHIVRDRVKGALHLDQKVYLENVLKRFGMNDCNGVSTPIERQLKLVKADGCVETNQPFKELIGCLIYAAITSRPDLCAAVNYLSQFQCCATDEHWSHLKRVLRYIKATLNLHLIYVRDQRADILCGFADADWAGDINDRKSVSGHVFKVFGATVSWSTRKQKAVALSSTEAEYVSLSLASCEVIWLKEILIELNLPIDGPITLYEDNQSCISIVSDVRDHKRVKHIDIRYNHIRDLVSQNKIKIEFISSENQLADIMTKGLVAVTFIRLRELLGLK